MFIFLSSTFRDMRVERQLIRDTIIPAFRKDYAHVHGESVNLVDLEWGLGTFHLEKSEAMRQVLSVCISEVAKCKPFIGLVGQFYGSEVKERTWLPENFPENLAKRILGDGMSVTEIEIRHALENGECNAIICLREIVGDLPQEVRESYIQEDARLTNFKNWLEKNHADKILHYRADWLGNELGKFRTAEGKDFQEALLERITQCCEPYWTKQEVWQKADQNFSWKLVDDNVSAFFGREALVDSVKSELLQNNRVMIFGVPGSGKTTLLSKVAYELKAADSNVFCLLANGSRYSNAQLWLEEMIFFFEESLSEPHLIFKVEGRNSLEWDRYAALKGRLMYLCEKLTKPVFFILDAIDLLDADVHRDRLEFLPPATENVHCLVSCTSEFKKSLDNSALRQIYTRELSLLVDDGEIIDVMGTLLKRYRRDFFPETQAEILKKVSAKNLLFLQMCAQNLNMISSRELIAVQDNPEDIVVTTVQFIEGLPDSEKGAAIFILERAVARLCKKPEVTMEALALLAISRNGLRQSDLEQLLPELSTLDFVRVRNYVHLFFIERPGDFCDFSSPIIKAAFAEKISEERTVYYIEKIASHLEHNLVEGDPLRVAEGFFFAQQQNNFAFAATLLKEATNNSAMLQEIRRVILSDNGKFALELFRYHLLEDSEKFDLVDKFIMIMAESSKDYKLMYELIASVQQNASEIDYYKYELLKAMQEIRLDQVKTARKRLLRLAEWGEKLPENEIDCYTCQIISNVYSRLGLISNSYSLLGILPKLYSWLRRITKSCSWLRSISRILGQKLYFADEECLWAERAFKMRNSLSTRFHLALAKFSRASIGAGNKVFEDLLEAYEILVGLHEERPTYMPYLRTLPLVCQNLGILYLDNDNRQALFFGREAEKFARKLLNLDAANLDAVMTTGMALSSLGAIELNLSVEVAEEEDSVDLRAKAKQHLEEGQQLIIEYHQKSPNRYSQMVLDNALKLKF